MKKFFTGLGQNSIVQKVLDPFLKKESSHLKIDQYRAALAFKCYDHCVNNDVSEPQPEDVETFYKEIDALHDSFIDKYVENRVSSQLIDLYEVLNKAEVATSSSTKRQKVIPDPVDLTADAPFSLLVKDSTLPSAGKGLFVTSKKVLLPGTVVALYPGLVHLKEHVNNELLHSLMPDDNMMLFLRSDNSLVDGRTADKTPFNPYGLGQFINHCGDQQRPNVMQLSFNYPEDILGKEERFPHHLRKFVPNTYAKPPSRLASFQRLNHFMRGVVFITTCHVKSGDELLMDYRINAAMKHMYPAWYKPFFEEESSESTTETKNE